LRKIIPNSLPASPKSDEENFEYVQRINRRIWGRCPEGGGGKSVRRAGGKSFRELIQKSLR
jgi:hypothetical protein